MFLPSDHCSGEAIAYRADLTYDEDYNKVINCLNDAGSCKRNICECDKALAMSLSQEEDNWNESYHTVKGGFKREEHCFRKGAGYGHPFVECCGDTTTFPYNQPRKDNQCCAGYEALPAGSC